MLLARNRILTTFLTHCTGTLLYRSGGNGSLRVMGQGRHRWKLLEWPGGDSGAGHGEVTAACAELFPPAHGSFGRECRREGEDALGPVWSGSTESPCLKVGLFLDTAGTDGSSVSTVAGFFPRAWCSGFFFVFLYWEVVLFLIAAML